MASKVITAAGGIVWRKSGPSGGIELLLVHRPRYDDWTFPKGKPEGHEEPPVTALREITEETGYRVRLVHPLPEVTYQVRGGLKRVAYWVARLVSDETAFQPNPEVDKITWFSPRDARKKLTYEHDRELLNAFEDLVAKKHHRSRTLILLRHAKAIPRDSFDGEDGDRPLTVQGHDRAKDLVSVLTAFGIRRVVSSPATRTVQTVDPYIATTDELLELDDRLAERTSANQVERVVESLLTTKRPTVACTHRPVLPDAYAALGINGPALSPGQALVIHHRKGKVLSTEVV